jgi:hypothetical protein
MRRMRSLRLREPDAEGGDNARLSTSWRDVISHLPRGIPCFAGTL